MLTISDRGALAAVDGAPVVEAFTVQLSHVPSTVACSLIVTITGGPATVNYRAAVEFSIDGGTTWQQGIRFSDITATASSAQFCRASANTSIGDATVAASSLGSAAASPVVLDTPWTTLWRAVTQLQALTGGASPTVRGRILADVT